MKNRLIALLLTLVMLMSMVVVPASAENEENGLSFSIISFTENGAGITEGNELSSIEKGQAFALKILLKNTTSEPYVVGAYQLLVQYNDKAVEVHTFKNGRNTVGPAVTGDLVAPQGNDIGNGVFKITGADGNGMPIDAKGDEFDYATVAYIMFEAKEDVETCDLLFALADGDNKITVTRESDPSKDFAMPGVSFGEVKTTVRVNGIAPVLSRVTVSTDEAGNEVILSSDKVDGAQDYTVTVNGTTVTPYTTYYAHAYSAMGTDMTGSVDWKIGTGAGFAGTTFDNGVIVVTPRAANITNAHISATQAGAGENGKDLTVSTDKTFSVSRESQSTITSLSISCDNTTLTVPTGSDPATAKFSVDARNIYDEKIPSPNYYWRITKDGTPITSGSGISLYASDNMLRVTRDALANIGTYTVQAYSGRSFDAGVKSNEITVTIKLADPEVSSLTVDKATMSVDIPKADSNGNQTKQTFDLPAVTVKDQYGRDIENRTLTWQTMGSDGEAVYPGITIENGKLVITSEAAKPAFFPEGSNSYQVPVRVSCGEKYADFTVTVTREARKAASITVSGGPTAALLVPASGESAVTSNEKFTAVVKDQYGHTIENASITWSAMMGSGAMVNVTGVSMTTDGTVTVESTAAEKVLDTNAITFTAIAEYVDEGNNAVVGYKTFTIARAASVATSITVVLKEGCADTLLIPGLDSTEATRQTEFVATVKDQYDAEIKNPSINWSIAPADVDGVTIDPTTGVVSVTTDAAKTIKDRTNFIVTAAVGTKTGTSTITVERELPRITGFHLYTANKDGKKGAPLTNNSTAIIADGTNFLFVAWPHTQYGVDFTDSTVWKVEIFAPDNSEAILTDTNKKATTNPTDYRTELPITSDIKDGTYRFVITQVSDKGEAVENPAKSEYSINLMRKQDAGLTISDGTTTGTSKTVTYGETFTLTATAAHHGTTGGTWTLGSFTGSAVLNANQDGGKLTLKALKAGETTFTMTYEDDTYYGSVTYTVTVDPKEVTAVLVNGAKVSKVYDGTTAGGSIVLPDNISAPVQLTGVIGTDELTAVPTLTGAYSTKDVHTGATNEFSLTLTLSGAAAGNYRLKNSSVAIPSEITPKPVRISGLTFESRQFAMNGYSATIDTLTFDGVVSGETLAYETGLIRVANNNVGTQSVEAFTVTLKNDNYCWTADVVGSTLTIPAGTYSVVITKAPYSDKTAETGAKFGNSASFPLKSDLFPAGANVQSITVTAPTGSIFDGTPSVTGTTLNYKIKADATPDQMGTITLAVESQNYETYNITVTVTVLDKTPQAIEAKNVTMIYGDTASGYVTNLSSLKGAVSYTLSNGRDVISVDSSTGRITALKPGEALISIYAAGDENTKDANKVITVTVTKRPLTVTANNISTYVGDKQPTLTYRFDGLVNNDNVGTWELTLSIPANVKDPMKTAGEYPIIFGVHTDGTDESKYDITLVPGKLTVTNYTIIDSTPLGSDITVIPAPGGTTRISTPKAVGGATVTITVTPDKDKELKSLEVIDENGSRLPLTDLGNGRFSFVMPAGKVSVSAVYGDVNDYVNPYLDVNESDWYYEAVKYVTVNGLMNGTGASRFEPNLATSRAMIWTILARMSGVDTTGGSVWYAAAQQWAIATGVSDGTNPNGTITREQLAAMLYRYAVSKGMVTAPVTADLSIYSDAASVSAYAVEAMQWAVGTGLINGMDGKLNPQGSATRAQVATMLMRFAQLSK